MVDVGDIPLGLHFHYRWFYIYYKIGIEILSH